MLKELLEAQGERVGVIGTLGIYDGEEWNLDFLVSKEELEILNNEGEMMDRIRKSFRRLKHGESI